MGSPTVYDVRSPAVPALEEEIRARALELGFDVCRFARADVAPEQGERLHEWLRDGAHGDMDWMRETAERRAAPRALWPEAASLVMLGLNYGPDGDPLASLTKPDCATISVYARNRDYHDVIKGRLKQLAGFMLKRAVAGDAKVFVDTAPVMEKPLAQTAGVGWQGKHTNLVSREFGSWLFLGAIFTTLRLEPDPPEHDHCGSCTKCLDACPTAAFPAPYRLDARRCISYLTIEHKGPIPLELRAKIGNRIYGCDDCLAVCPWNKYASAGREAKLAARPEFDAPPLAELARLDDSAFRALFAGSPIKRIGRDRFLRNVLIAIGNSARPELAAEAERLIADAAAIVRGAAVWALGRLAPTRAAELRPDRLAAEPDAAVSQEWRQTA
ncbi:tRNA epoxyqueuosine(34) reductase QueG [Methylocystis rosea]|uniref:tRNA epoxyqueuosine(34) reductase QueG n=1 Tax=Methylocystis rosea TaxID=173366 RepID=UPI0006871B6B|nr:tRNA epoxyqueuosine(34) reductase QueG [Methylocystis rosea]